MEVGGQGAAWSQVRGLRYQEAQASWQCNPVCGGDI